MPSQLDAIAPREIVTRAIPVTASTGEVAVLTVRGLSSRDFLMLRRRFPQLRDPAFLAALGQDDLSEDIGESFVEIVGPIIACGIGAPGDMEAEGKALWLTDQDQIAVFQTIMELSTPEASSTRPPASGRPSRPRKKTRR